MGAALGVTAFMFLVIGGMDAVRFLGHRGVDPVLAHADQWAAAFGIAGALPLALFAVAVLRLRRTGMIVSGLVLAGLWAGLYVLVYNALPSLPG